MIELEHVVKEYPGNARPHRVLDDVSFTIRRGQSVGILGRNGAGKSTFTLLLTGTEQPTSGRIRRRMSVSWPLAVGAGLHTSLTGAGNARFVARLYGAPLDRTVGFVQEFAELGRFMSMPVRTYSSGMRARLAFALSLAVRFDCLVVDEITAVGDHRFKEKCWAALEERRQDGALVMVSHQPETLRSFCDTAAVLDRGRLYPYDNLDDAIARYETL